MFLGNLNTDNARKLATIVEKYASQDIRITINQGFLLKYVRPEALPSLYTELNEIGLANPGFDSVADITACPGTDTCNLGISSSTGIAGALEKVIKAEFSDLIYNHDIKIKISGCMNSCGQHSLAQIGFHGSSFKVGAVVVPALQVLLGGGVLGNGGGRISDKVIKVPSKRGPDVLRKLLLDFENNAVEGEYFNSYYDRQGKNYFYKLLTPVADTSTISPDELIDWNKTENFETAIGVGECAGVMIDLVATLLFEAEEKLQSAAETLANQSYGDSIYHSYATYISIAKALLIEKQVHCNTQHGIINDFQKYFVDTQLFSFQNTFSETVLQINKNEPAEKFAENFFENVKSFYQSALNYRNTIKQENTVNHE